MGGAQFSASGQEEEVPSGVLRLHCLVILVTSMPSLYHSYRKSLKEEIMMPYYMLVSCFWSIASFIMWQVGWDENGAIWLVFWTVWILQSSSLSYRVILFYLKNFCFLIRRSIAQFSVTTHTCFDFSLIHVAWAFSTRKTEHWWREGVKSAVCFSW
jgi:hypothetical protein